MVSFTFTPYITYAIIAITVFVSYKAFEDYSIKRKFLFVPYLVKHQQEYYRMFSHSVIHADWMHLGLNAYVLYSFGSIVEGNLIDDFGLPQGRLKYILLYVGGVLVSTLYSLAKHQDNASYSALGASGAVSAVVFASVLMEPSGGVLMFFILPLPGWLFGILYLLYSHYMMKNGNDNIGHDAHISGALFGLAITILFDPNYLFRFVNEIF